MGRQNDPQEADACARWTWLVARLERDLRVSLFVLGYLFLFRLVFIACFRDRLAPETGALALVAGLLSGLRYDAIVASYATLLPLGATVGVALRGGDSTASGLRLATGATFGVVLSLACVGAIGYYAEYGEVFDEHLFGLFLDDAGAIALTLWKSYHPLRYVAAAAALALGSALGLRWLLERESRVALRIGKRTARVPARVAVILALLVGLGIGLRGSFGRRPAQLKDAAVTGDLLLDQAALNPVVALRYALKSQIEILQSSGLERFLPDRDLERAARTLFGPEAAEASDIDRSMLRSAAGAVETPPRHIFLIVGEGLSAWPLLDRHGGLSVASGLRRLADRGIHVERFLPASYGTIESLGAIFTGLPDAEVHTNYRESARQAYPSSPAPIFRQLGYRTRFFYGGYLSWQRVGAFARDQGFEEVYGGSSMGSWVESNEWGVDDEYLLDFVRATVRSNTPSFNVVLTTSLHPPYDVDVRSRGYVPAPGTRSAEGAADPDLEGFLSHYWYADQCIEAFVRSTASALPSSLFAITGDHPSRVRRRGATLFDERAVPLILYGPEALRDVETRPGLSGSHVDIAPTLIELVAPRGFRYPSLGRSLLRSPPGPGIGQHTVIGAERILDLRHGPVLDASAEQKPAPAGLDRTWRTLHDAAHGIAWWRIMRGPRWQPTRGSPREREMSAR